jgi:multicomponent Na+:H+ antiporter subunit E
MSKQILSYSFTSYLFRVLFFAIIWLGLVEGNLDSLSIGIFVVVISSLISLKLIPPFPLNLKATIPFAGFFLWRSLLGGIDVAKRVWSKKLLINPDIITFQISINNELAIALFINTVNLLPGTLVVDIKNNLLEIHVLDKNMNNLHELEEIENKILNLFKMLPEN